MSKILPKETIDVFRTFNDLAIDLFGISCTLYIPTNLTTLEPSDVYTEPEDITYTTYTEQQIWIEWFAKDIHKLRKLGIFSENEAPITAWFKLSPEVTIGSYFQIESRYIPDSYDTDEFEVVDVILQSMYDHEVYRRFKIAPRRKKNT